VSHRVIVAAKGGVFGFLVVGLCVVFFTMTLGTIVSIFNLGTVSLSLGPIPLARAWSDASGYGMSSGDGLGALCYAGALAGVVVALRRRPARA
jgi:hypothetical protein